MVWGDVKGYVGRENNTFKTNDVKHLIIKGFKTITTEKWSAKHHDLSHVKIHLFYELLRVFSYNSFFFHFTIKRNFFLSLSHFCISPFLVADVGALGFKTITTEKWTNFCNHVENKIEPQYWKSDHIIEEIPKIIINLDSVVYSDQYISVVSPSLS
jgi:hypothetical protein